MRVSLVLLAAVFASTARAQQPAPPAADSDYATSDVMIPMRDGVRLHTVIVTPKNATAPLPILMERTPYRTEGVAARVPRPAPAAPQAWRWARAGGAGPAASGSAATRDRPSQTSVGSR